MSISTEGLILEAARKVFARKGLEAARMQEIADEAGINKALLHYYFRSIEKLFELVFREVLGKFIGGMKGLLNEDIPFFSKIEGFIDGYLDILFQNPYLPGFIVMEIHRNPAEIVSFMESRDIPIKLFESQITEEAARGNIRAVDPRHLVVNMIGMCVFPFIAKPILNAVLFGGSQEAYRRFLDERKETIKATIIESLKIK